jgi:hypothetical protein
MNKKQTTENASATAEVRALTPGTGCKVKVVKRTGLYGATYFSTYHLVADKPNGIEVAEFESERDAQFAATAWNKALEGEPIFMDVDPAVNQRVNKTLLEQYRDARKSKTYRAFNRKSEEIRVTIPESEAH